MSEPATESTISTARPPAFSAGRMAITIMVLMAITAVAYVVLVNHIAGRDPAAEAAEARRGMGLGEPVKNRLASRFKDTDGDLVADAPAGTADLINPAELTFSFIATEDPSVYEEQWSPFVAYLSEKLGRPVKYVAYTSRDDQLRAIRDGELHLAGLNTGAVPIAVNVCGFVPVCTPGSEQGANAYRMVIIVPGESKLQRPADIRGETFAFTEPTSNSGFKAALVLLETEFGLKIGEDYAYAFAHSHAGLVRAIAEKRYAAGATASDLLQRAIDAGEIANDAVRVLYESEPFPTAAIGYCYNLDPALADRVRSAALGFRFAGTPLEAAFAADGSDRLVPVSYKDDFALIRRIDDAVGYDHAAALDREPEVAAGPAEP